MSENGKIEIEIEDDQVRFSSNLSMAEMNFWLDHVKYLIHTGQMEIEKEQ